MKKIVLKNTHLSGYLVAEHLVVFNQRDSQLQALDEMGGWLLLALDDGISQEEICDTLQERGIPKTQIVESMVAIQSLFLMNQNFPENITKSIQKYLRCQSIKP
jgi:SET domain-containing protein